MFLFVKFKSLVAIVGSIVFMIMAIVALTVLKFPLKGNEGITIKALMDLSKLGDERAQTIHGLTITGLTLASVAIIFPIIGFFFNGGIIAKTIFLVGFILQAVSIVLLVAAYVEFATWDLFKNNLDRVSLAGALVLVIFGGLLGAGTNAFARK